MAEMLMMNKTKKHRKSKSVEVDRHGIWFVLPFMVITAVFVILPILANIILSFTNYNIVKLDLVGLVNYKYLVQDTRFLQSLWNTIIFTVVNLPLTMAVGLMLALALKEKLFGLKFFRTCVYLPNVLSMACASMMWVLLLDPASGMVNILVKSLGLQAQNWLYSTATAMPSIIVMSIWKSAGYFMVIYLSGLMSVPGYIYEAAKIDGANAWTVFWRMTLPLIRPTTFFLFITGFMNNFRMFEQVNIMTEGGPENSTTTIVHQIYSRAFTENKLGYAAAEAVVLLIIVIGITVLNFKYGKQGDDNEAA